MAGIPLQDMANIIILISATIIALKTIFAFFKKPVDDLQERVKSNEEKYIEKVLENKMPGLLQQNCKAIIGAIDELKEMTLDQEGQLTEVQNSLNLLNETQKDMLRYNMNKLYYKYRPYKKVLSADKKAFMKLYKDYKSMDGNTWIDALYAEFKDWPIVEDQDELRHPENGKV